MYIGLLSSHPVYYGDGSTTLLQPTRCPIILPRKYHDAFSLNNNRPFSSSAAGASSRYPLLALNAYKEIYSSIPHPETSSSRSFPEEDPVSKIDLLHAHECADHFGKCSLSDVESMKKALHTERVQTSFLGNSYILLNPAELMDHYQLEKKLSEQLLVDHDPIPVKEWIDLSQNPGNALVMMIPTNPMNHDKNTNNDFFSVAMDVIRQLNTIPGFIEILTLVLIWIFLLPKPLFE